jgi:hypothetical protein
MKRETSATEQGGGSFTRGGASQRRHGAGSKAEWSGVGRPGESELSEEDNEDRPHFLSKVRQGHFAKIDDATSFS